MRDDAPDLYSRTLIDAVAFAPELIRVVIGGPHMGTTTVLGEILDRMGVKNAVSARRDPEAARKVIAGWSEGKPELICVDNVDEIIAELPVQQHLIAARRGHAVFGGFFSIDHVRNQYRAKAASAREAGHQGVLSPTDLWWQKAYVTYLNPWGYPRRESWERSLVDHISDRLKKALREFHQSDDLRQLRKEGRSFRVPVDSTIRRAAEALVRVAGGHPMLIGRGYQKLFVWMVGEAPTKLDELGGPLADELKSISFDTFLDAARAVLRETPEGFGALLELATTADSRPRILPHADLLRAAGLVREVLDKNDAVWELVHPQVRLALEYVEAHREDRSVAPVTRPLAAGAAAAPRVRIRPDARQPEQRGSIERADDGSILLELSARQWTLLRILADARGQPITVNQLAEQIDMGRTAVNPGLQRLREKLRKAGLEHLVYNVDGAGYAIDIAGLETD